METENNDPCFLELETYHLSERLARQTVTELLLSSGIKSPKGGWDKFELTIGKEEKFTFRELTQITRKSGIVGPIQRDIDHSDEIFGRTFGISTPTTALGQVTTTYAGFSRTLKPPMRNMPVESDLSLDILFYREETCMWSNEYDFQMCARSYRSYLMACIALVDAFINRHILIYRHNKLDSDEFNQLQTCPRLEDRLNLFLIISSGENISSINGGTEWIHFKALRNLRNEMIHINSPFLGYSIQEFSDHLNLCKLGIGGLLKLIRNVQKKQSLGFIERVRTAPIAHANDITFKSENEHIVRRKK